VVDWKDTLNCRDPTVAVAFLSVAIAKILCASVLRRFEQPCDMIQVP
jgi:hypothetical protein